jgi:predicted dehydrogenase
MDRLAVGLVGAGNMGRNHARAVAGHRSTELAAVVDADLGAAIAVAEMYGGIASTRLDALDACDAVILAIPTEHHVRIGLELLRAGMPVLIEKPLALDLQGAAALIDAARTGSAVLLCGFVERFNPAVRTGLACVTAPPTYIQTVRHSPATPRVTSSVVADLLIHDLDLVSGFVALGAPQSVRSLLTGIEQTDVADQADVLLGWHGGPVANLSASRLGQRKIRSLAVTTPEELVEIDLLRQNVTVSRHLSQELTNGMYRSGTVTDIPFVRHAGEPLVLQLEHFVDCVRGDADPSAELDTLLPAHELADFIERDAVRVGGLTPRPVPQRSQDGRLAS